MKKRIGSLIAVVMAAIFVLGCLPVMAAPSYEKVNKDYRNMSIMNKSGVTIKKPTAQFCANRVVNGEIKDIAISYADYDCNVEFPTLTCYVGDTVTFTDMSHDNNGGKLVEWDWQYFGNLGESHNLYKSNIVNTASYTLTSPGETIFYLCVKSDAVVKTGCCDPWSENGNHQTVGKNKWFPKGAYWYFTAIRVVTKPIREGKVHIRYWDAPNNKIFYEEEKNVGTILDDADTIETSVHITDWDGYKYSGWNVQLPDGTIQYEGVERDVGIILAGWVPEKNLNVEFYPMNNKELTVNYVDCETDKIIKSNVIKPNSEEPSVDVNVKFENISNYVIEDWILSKPEGDTIQAGTDDPVDVTLTDEVPKQILTINCFHIEDDDGGDSYNPDDNKITVKPSGVCDGVITWTETDSHRVFTGYTKSGKKTYKTCYHTFTYKTVLTADKTITPTTLKSGYGFEVNVNCSLSTKLISNDGGCSSWGNSRTNTAKVKDPTVATVYLPWDMTNRLGSQGRTIKMDSNGRLKFRLPISPVSEAGARKIYTPVELPGTKEAPKSHSFEIYIGGGGVGSEEFCQKLTGTITINGDMYEDDFSGAD